MNETAQRDPLARSFTLIEKRWVLEIVRACSIGARRHAELGRSLGASNESMRLALAYMVEKGLLTRTAYAEFPPRVDYELTPKGLGLLPVVRALEGWVEVWGS